VAKGRRGRDEQTQRIPGGCEQFTGDLNAAPMSLPALIAKRSPHTGRGATCPDFASAGLGSNDTSKGTGPNRCIETPL